MEIKNKKDFINAMMALMEYKDVYFRISSVSDSGVSTYFTLRDREMSRLFDDLATMDELYSKGSITEKMFDEWKKEATERIKG